MFKKYEITRTYYVHLHCDKCGEKMELTDVRMVGSRPTYKFGCTCGYEISTHRNYPEKLIVVSGEGEEMTPEEMAEFNRYL